MPIRGLMFAVTAVAALSVTTTASAQDSALSNGDADDIKQMIDGVGGVIFGESASGKWFRKLDDFFHPAADYVTHDGRMGRGHKFRDKIMESIVEMKKGKQEMELVSKRLRGITDSVAIVDVNFTLSPKRSKRGAKVEIGKGSKRFQLKTAAGEDVTAGIPMMLTLIVQKNGDDWVIKHWRSGPTGATIGKQLDEEE